ncbi:MAG: flagellar protein FlgN [Agathobacter sp.]|uniref:flagellar protein FlgN n=1 Tax=Agathobacter sp. TaxID=2021311 RepID=UPI002584853A|nr:flagellar protein FlgN [Agathobacter sp.]MCR5677544.1 flagellar protein FlgN [Agathobacter sp.]
MASLVEELVEVLHNEKEIYGELIECGTEKKDILIRGDIPALEALTEKEQALSDRLLSESNRQIALLGDIANVLGKGSEQMTVTKLIVALASQPQAAQQLTDARDQLLEAANEMQRINVQNEALLNQAIELTEFDITLFKSLRQAPETANYNRNAYNTGALLGGSGFDAKQ